MPRSAVTSAFGAFVMYFEKRDAQIEIMLNMEPEKIDRLQKLLSTEMSEILDMVCLEILNNIRRELGLEGKPFYDVLESDLIEEATS